MRNPLFSKPCLSPEAFPSEAGTPLVKLYEPVFDGRSTSLREVGTKNIQKEMDALAKYCDINYMLSQLANGDTSCLSSSQPLYGDFSQLPNNPADVLNLINSAQSAFGQLPASERARYSNDWRVWFTANLQDSGPSVDTSANDSVPADSVQLDNLVKEDKS